MNKPKVFVIMPFGDEFFQIYNALNAKFENEFYFSNAANEDNQQNILQDIVQPIYEADIILADLTGLNANVLYELGLAHTMNRKTIIITQDNLDTLPFDLKQYRAKNYSTYFTQFNELVEHLDKALHGALDGSVVFSNPVKDFLNVNNISSFERIFNEDKISIEIDEEKGFIDFLSVIEEETLIMTSNIEAMVKDMNTLSEGTNKSTIEIERVGKNGSSSTSFAQKEARKVADLVSSFAKNMNVYNSSIENSWINIEKNVLGLLESDYLHIEENKESMREFLLELHDMQNIITDTNVKVSHFQDSLNNNKGIERRLNQGIKRLDSELHSFLDIMSQMHSSVQKIKAKAKFVVGEVNYP